jgi:hypothetical protein
VVPAPTPTPDEIGVTGPLWKFAGELLFEVGLFVVVCGVLEPVGVRFGGMNGGTF